MTTNASLRPGQVIQAVLSKLKDEDYGYSEQPQPLRIVELSFEFDAVLAGPQDHQDLVLLVEQEVLNIDAIRRRLTRLALALQRTGSQRPVALVLVAPPSTSADLERLRPLARVVTVPRIEQSSGEVAEALRAFRPIGVDHLAASPVSAKRELATTLGAAATTPVARRLLAAASDGEQGVRQVFHDLFLEALAGPGPSTASSL
jgi:hypothetical protein